MALPDSGLTVFSVPLLPNTRDLRVFYRIGDDQVLVDAIGRKRGNQLFISGRKVTL